MIHILDLIDCIYSSYEGKEFRKVTEKVEKVKETLKELIVMGKIIPCPRILEKRIEEIRKINTELIIEKRKQEIEQLEQRGRNDERTK